MMGENTTLDRILSVATQEFLKNGFQGASLRGIVKSAGVTTGAFYRYFPTKEALFDALVKPYADHIRALYCRALDDIQVLPAEQQAEEMTHRSTDCIEEMLDYVYSNYINFKLLLCSSHGTVYEHFLHELVELEVDSTFRFMKTMELAGHPMPKLDRDLCHMIASGLMSGIFEMVIHDMCPSEARRRVRQLREFYTGGWERLFGISFG